MHPVHTVKKRVASATTKKKVQKDIGEDFTENKRLLESIQTTLNGYCKSVEESTAAWSSLFKVQREFVSNMTASYPRGDSVRATSQQYASNLTSLQSNFTLSDAADAPYKELHRTVQKYLEEIKAVQASYPEVELTYSEYLRYSQKSDRLVARKNRNEAKIERNLEKREKSRVEYHSKLDATVTSMRSIASKHPVVFQLAMCSFWLRNNQTMRLFTDHTGQMHSESDSLKELFVKVDLSDSSTFATLIPAPTDVPIITYPPSQAPPHLQIMAPPTPEPAPQAPVGYPNSAPPPSPPVTYSAPPPPVLAPPPAAVPPPAHPVVFAPAPPPAPPAPPPPPPGSFPSAYSSQTLNLPPALHPATRPSSIPTPPPPPPPPTVVTFPHSAADAPKPPPPPKPPAKRPVAA